MINIPKELNESRFKGMSVLEDIMLNGVGEWHETPKYPGEIYEFMEMTKEDYYHWLHNPDEFYAEVYLGKYNT